MWLALTAGYRVFVCHNMAFLGDFTPLLHKHTAKFHLRDAIAIAVDRIHRGPGTLADQIKEMRSIGLTDNDARLMIYDAFMEKAIKEATAKLAAYLSNIRADLRGDAAEIKSAQIDRTR